MDDSMSLSLSTTGVYSKYSTNLIDTESSDSDDTGYMDFDSYLQLLVAQMQNQDFNDPMDDSEVLNQMAQYSMLEGIKNMTQQSNISYATSLVGKIVTVNDGYDYYTGKVESVTVSDGTPYLMIDGKAYDSSTLTDVVDFDTYNELYSYVGKNVTITTSGETGTVTEIIFLSGESYVVLNGKDAVPLAAVKITETDETTGSTDSTESTETTTESTDESTEAAENTTEESTEETYTETSEVESYEVMSASLIDTFMKELDAIDESNGVSAVSETSGISAIDEQYILETAMLQVPDYAAGVYADGNIVTSTVTLDGVDSTYGSGTVTKASSADLNPETAERTSNGNLKGVTTEKSVSTGDCVPHRISVEDYPEEAALADELGTRMYDIRYIHNTAITSRIKTDEIIGYTQSGKAVTEIGYSGVGQLGEVVTFADGTQRVEILLKSGKSTWMMTSGNLTLDEICTREWAPGSLTGKLTPVEQAIRHYSNPTEEFNQSALNNFDNYLRAQGITVV